MYKYYNVNVLNSKMTDSENIVFVIIDTIKNRVITQENTLDEYTEGWNDNEAGVNWIYNEVILFNNLYKSAKIDENFNSHNINFQHIHDIKSMEKILLSQPLSYLTYLQNFVLTGGIYLAKAFELKDSECPGNDNEIQMENDINKF